MSIDLLINSKIVLFQTPFLTKIMTVITGIGSEICLAVLSIILFCYLIYKKRYQNSLLLAFGMLGGLLIELSIKAIVQRERPESMLIAETGYSFPSAHSLMALVFFAILIYAVKDDLKNAFLRYLFIAASILIVLLVSFSRLYLGVHWLSDVIGGLIIGTIWLLLLIMVFKFLKVKS
jgi:undecaprenyl-diphosphatase